MGTSEVRFEIESYSWPHGCVELKTNGQRTFVGIDAPGNRAKATSSRDQPSKIHMLLKKGLLAAGLFKSDLPTPGRSPQGTDCQLPSPADKRAYGTTSAHRPPAFVPTNLCWGHRRQRRHEPPKPAPNTTTPFDGCVHLALICIKKAELCYLS